MSDSNSPTYPALQGTRCYCPIGQDGCLTVWHYKGLGVAVQLDKTGVCALQCTASLMAQTFHSKGITLPSN